MSHYIVSWVIDVFDADDHHDAARKALAIQRDPDSVAVVFSVKEPGNGPTIDIDLDVTP